tara:strand:+ start:1004 stop:1618 length:615 start_codon:yes stop_codon:yes gene_type:complete
MKKKHVLIGIDIGIRNNTGVAIYHPEEKKFKDVISCDMFEAMQICIKQNESKKKCVVVVVENADMDSNIFGADTDLLSYISRSGTKNKKGLTKKIRQVLAWASNVGKNKGAAIAFIHHLQQHNITYAEIAPSKRRRAGKVLKIGKREVKEKISQLPMPTKTTAADFKFWTGYCGKTNEHSRDAGTLVFKKTYFYYATIARTQKK